MSDEDLLFQRVLRVAVRLRATDIHIDPLIDGFAVRVRVDGALWDHQMLDPEAGLLLINQLKAEVGLDPGRIFAPHSSRHTYEIGGHEIDMRITAVPCISGEKIAIRILDPERVEHHIGDLGLRSDDLQLLQGWLDGLDGMFLVSGPTNSGKTTTLYALLHQLAQRDRHVLTIEDPVEYEIDGINQIQVDRAHGLDFAGGLTAMLRLDPDYLFLGELREPEAIEVAARAATSGHVLLSTIHARDAVSTVTALRSFGMSGNMIAVTLSVIVNQRLVRKLCTECCREGEFSELQLSWLRERGIDPAGARAVVPVGCSKCGKRGYVGRTGLFEVWRLDSGDYDLLLSGADERRIREKLAGQGHRNLVMHGWEKVCSGVTSVAELQHAAGALRADDWMAI